MKIKCDHCTRLATWQYEPGDGESYYCDNCVPRGCSCMVDENDEYLLDDKGRESPCCEFSFHEFGIDEWDDDAYYAMLAWCEEHNY